jgi:hypothetical protein
MLVQVFISKKYEGCYFMRMKGFKIASKARTWTRPTYQSILGVARNVGEYLFKNHRALQQFEIYYRDALIYTTKDISFSGFNVEELTNA